MIAKCFLNKVVMQLQSHTYLSCLFLFSLCIQELSAHVISINSEENVIFVRFQTFEEIWKFTTYYTTGMFGIKKKLLSMTPFAECCCCSCITWKVQMHYKWSLLHCSKAVCNSCFIDKYEHHFSADSSSSRFPWSVYGEFVVRWGVLAQLSGGGRCYCGFHSGGNTESNLQRHPHARW